MASRAHQGRELTIAVNKIASNTHGWATLFPDLLLLILLRLTIKDYVRFGAVCVPWSRIVTEKLVSPMPQLPLLIVDPVRSNLPLVMFDPFVNKVECRTRFQERGLFLLGSTSDGYMLVSQENNSQVLVINPLTGSRIPLPSINNLMPKGHLIFKAALWHPTTGGTAVVAIAYNFSRIAFSRAGDERWTLLDKSEMGIQDIIFYKGLLYVTTRRSSGSWDIRIKNPPMQKIPYPDGNEYQNRISERFLVQSSSNSDLLQVFFNPTKPIKIFKLDLAGTPKWCIVTRLCGDDALMLSPKRSICISTREFPVLQGNSIYSTLYLLVPERNRTEEYSPLSVYSLENGTMEYLPIPGLKLGLKVVWFTPCL